MNLYFLVEGAVTESILYPAWLAHILPLHRRVRQPSEATENCYYLISGQGYPQILNQIPPAVDNIRANNVFSYLVFCADVEDDNPIEKKALILRKLEASQNKLPTGVEFKVILQMRCIESWLLGNRTVFPKNPISTKLKKYIDMYNVHEQCPELMDGHDDFMTRAAFHFDYLKLIFKEHAVRMCKIILF